MFNIAVMLEDSARTVPDREAVVCGTTRLTYAQVDAAANQVANLLVSRGIESGDKVALSCPNLPYFPIVYYGILKAGAVVVPLNVLFKGREVAYHLDDSDAKAYFCFEGPPDLPMGQAGWEGFQQVSGCEHFFLIEAKPGGDPVIEGAEPFAAAVAEMGTTFETRGTEAGDTAVILYTSGTTGKPKGVVRDNGGHAVALRWSMENIYDTLPGEVYWAASDIGWVVGHSYIVYAPLLAGCTSVLYEGKPVGTPDAGAFWRVITEHRVKTLFTAPTAFRAIKKEDPAGELTRKHDLSAFRYLFLAGERLDPETYRWARELLGIPVIDHWWQTETGWPVAADLMGLDPMATKPGSPTVPVPGYDVHVVDPATGADVPPGTTGEIVLRLPLPPGCLTTLWGDDQRFIDSYLARYPGAYLTGDGGHRDSDGYLYVMGRTDDVINVAGHRLSTGEMEEVLASHPAVAECAVIGVNDQLKGQIPRGFVVLKAGIGTDPDVLSAELVELIRDQIGPVAALRRVDIIAGLPKTRSGKILRKTMRGIADGATMALCATRISSSSSLACSSESCAPFFAAWRSRCASSG